MKLNENNIVWVTALTVSLMVLLLLALLSGCMTEKKATRYLHENKQAGATFCAEEYPVKETVKIDTVQLVDTAYSIEVKYDTVQRDPIVIEKTLPGKIITNTKYITKTVTVENTAKINELSAKLGQLEKENNDLKLSGQKIMYEYELLKKKQAGKLLISWTWIFAFIAGCMAMIFRKNMFGLIKRFI